MNGVQHGPLDFSNSNLAMARRSLMKQLKLVGFRSLCQEHLQGCSGAATIDFHQAQLLFVPRSTFPHWNVLSFMVIDFSFTRSPWCRIYWELTFKTNNDLKG